jgi:hypothetical protein
MRGFSGRSICRCTSTTISIGQICKFSLSFFWRKRSIKCVSDAVDILKGMSPELRGEYSEVEIEAGPFASRLACFVRWSWTQLITALFVGWKLATQQRQYDDPTTSKFSGSQPYPPGSPGLSWCRCTDRGIFFQEWKNVRQCLGK